MVRSLAVLFGTQTGCSQEVAERIANDAVDRGFAVTFLPVDGFPLASWTSFNGPIVFVCSTTGQGDVPDTMRATWDELRMSDCQELDGLSYAVFGLGDSTYVEFNYTAKKLHNRLKQLGGAPLIHRGLGDEQDRRGVDDALKPWVRSLWEALFPIVESSETSPSLEGQPIAPVIASGAAPLVPRFKWSVNAAHHSEQSPVEPRRSQADVDRGPCYFRTRVVANRRLTAPDHFQDVRHIELSVNVATIPLEAYARVEEDSSESPIDAAAVRSLFAPGDAAVVFPVNTSEAVNAMLHRMNLRPEAVVEVRPTSRFVASPPSGGLVGTHLAWNLMAHHLDFNGTATQTFLRVLATFATDEEEIERLNELGSPDHLDEFYEYCVREKRSYLEVLQDFSAIRMPLDAMICSMRPLRPRYFSISSAPPATTSSSVTLEPTEAGGDATITLTVAVLEVTTPFKRQRVGLCSGYLAHECAPGTELQIALATGVLHPPRDDAAPLILIGPGTGIAPLRSLVCFRQRSCGAGSGPVHLFTGHRNRKSDFLYGDEWFAMANASEGYFTVYSAFSRDGGDGPRYVQHAMRQTQAATSIAKLLLHDSRTCVFVSGNAKQMPADVRTTFIDILRAAGIEDPSGFVDQMRREKRYLAETWGQ